MTSDIYGRVTSYRSWEIDPVLDNGRLYEIGETVQLPPNRQKAARRATVVHMNQPGALRDGDTVHLEVEGIFKAADQHRGYEPSKEQRIVSSLDGATTLAKFTRYATVLKLNDPPKWRAGDVIDVTFSKSEPVPYTYVRADTDWPGNTRRLSDARVNDLWANGQVEVVRKR